MRLWRLLPAASAVAIVAIWPLAAARAQAPGEIPHTWVASTGSNGNSCDRTSPCATFGGAYNKTAAGGEISCIDAGNFGGVQITKSLTINCENTVGSNTPGPSNATTAFTILTASASDIVTLRGLDLDGLGFNCITGCAPILFQGQGTLQLDKVKVSNMRGIGHGIHFVPFGHSRLEISNSFITNNGSTGVAAGVLIQPSSGVVASVNISNSHILNNRFGIIADASLGGAIRGVVVNSNVSESTNNGITVSTPGPNVVLAIDNTTVANNSFGLVATGANAGMLVRRSFITGNATGLFTNGGVLLSYRDNSVNNNTSDGAFTGAIGLQ